MFAQPDRLRRFDDQRQAVAGLGQLPEGRRLRQQHPVARLVRDGPEFGREYTAAAMHEVEEIALHIAIAIGIAARRRLIDTATSSFDSSVGQRPRGSSASGATTSALSTCRG